MPHDETNRPQSTGQDNQAQTTMHRIRARSDDRYGDLADVMRAALAWRSKWEDHQRPHNRQAEHPVMETDVDAAEWHFMEAVRVYKRGKPIPANTTVEIPFALEDAPCAPRMTHDRPVMPGWYWYALPDTWTIQPAWVYRYEGELWYTLDAIPDGGPDDGFEMAQCSEDAIWSAEPMQSLMPHSSQAEIRALRAFHDFFSEQTERLFAEFGMPAVDLYNAVRAAQRATPDKALPNDHEV